jgi:hypothetical protein
MDQLSKLLELLSGKETQKGVPSQTETSEETKEKNVVSSILTSDERSKWVEITTILGNTVQIGKFVPDSKHRSIAKIFADEIAQAFQAGKYKPYQMDVLSTPSVSASPELTKTTDQNNQTLQDPKKSGILSSVVGIMDNFSGLIGGVLPTIIGAISIIGGSVILTALIYKLPDIIKSLESFLPYFSQFLLSTWPLIKEVLPKFQEFLIAITPSVKLILSELLPHLTRVFETIYTNITNVFGKVVEMAGGAIDTIIPQLSKLVTNITNTIGSIAGQVITVVGGILDNVIERSAASFNRVIEFIDKNLQPALNTLNSILTNVWGSIVAIADKFQNTILGSLIGIKNILSEIKDGFSNVADFIKTLINTPADTLKNIGNSLWDLSKGLAAIASVSLGATAAGVGNRIMEFIGGGGVIEQLIRISDRSENIHSAGIGIKSLVTSLTVLLSINLSNANQLTSFLTNIDNMNPTHLVDVGNAFGVFQQKLGYLASYSTDLEIAATSIKDIVKSADGLLIIDDTIGRLFQNISKLDTSKLSSITIKADIVQINKTNEILSSQLVIQKKILQEIINNGKAIGNINTNSSKNTTLLQPGGSESIPTTTSQTPRQLFNNSAYSFGIK